MAVDLWITEWIYLASKMASVDVFRLITGCVQLNLAEHTGLMILFDIEIILLKQEGQINSGNFK